MVNRHRINLGRRLTRLERQLPHWVNSEQHRHLAIYNVDHLATQLQEDVLSSSTTTDPLLNTYQQRLHALQTILSNVGQLDTLPRPQYNLSIARRNVNHGVSSSSHIDILNQLRGHTVMQRNAHLRKRQQLLENQRDIINAPSIMDPLLKNEHQGSDNQLLSQPIASPTTTTLTTPSLHSNDLTTQQKLHDHLTSGLIDMVQTLKSNAQAFSDGLKTDHVLISQTEQNLSSNLSRMNKENKRIKSYRSVARWTTWMLIIILIVVAIISIGLFIVIKLF